MADIRQSTAAYEDWLRRQLGGDIVEDDLKKKHKTMKDSAFAFLRATYWRWAETVLDICPDAADAPHVLAVGDIHLENFGTWRDAEGRLVWGVNDFDEAAEMPYVLDLMRLAASAFVAGSVDAARAKAISTGILAGYRAGLQRPRPVVLDRDFDRLRALVEVSDKKRAKFWSKIEALPRGKAPERFRQALVASMPEAGLAFDTYTREAGVGSLGRPRWVGRAEWRGAPVVREAKALVPSAWDRARGNAKAPIRSGEIANGPYRAMDPWYRISVEASLPHEGLIVRRLSPNNRKIEAEDADGLGALLTDEMLKTMGLELANVHLGTAKARDAIERDLARRKDGWLAAGAGAMAKAVQREQQEWAAAAAA
jgi:hypothetical protein